MLDLSILESGTVQPMPELTDQKTKNTLPDGTMTIVTYANFLKTFQ